MEVSKRWNAPGHGPLGLAVGLAIGILAAVGSAGAVSAETTELGIGTEVLLESPSTELKVGKEVVATGASHRLYRVGRIAGEWLWIVAGDVRGWVHPRDVITFDQAMQEYDRKIAYSPYSAGAAYFNRGNLWLHKQEWARALDDFTEALKQSPKDPCILHNRGLAWFQVKKYNGAIADFTAALAIDPKYAWAYEDRARTWAAAGSYDAAIADYTAEIQLEPAAAAAFLGRGLAFVETGQPDWAIADLSEALRLNPRLARAYTGRGVAWKAKQDYQHALDDLNEALRLNPRDADAHGALATIRATCPIDRYRDGSLAFAAATRAYRLHGKTCPTASTLWAPPMPRPATSRGPSRGRPRPSPRCPRVTPSATPSAPGWHSIATTRRIATCLLLVRRMRSRRCRPRRSVRTEPAESDRRPRHLRSLLRLDRHHDRLARISRLHHEVDRDVSHHGDGHVHAGEASAAAWSTILPAVSVGPSRVLLPDRATVTPGGSGVPWTPPRCRRMTSRLTGLSKSLRRVTATSMTALPPGARVIVSGIASRVMSEGSVTVSPRVLTV